MRSDESPVVVVGAGPVGLTAAVELARREVPVRVVDSGSGPSTTSKAIGIHARTLELLERVGVADRLVDRGLAIRSFRFHDRGRVLAELPLGGVPSAYPYALSLGQDVTERVLLDRLSELGVEVEWGVGLRALRQEAGEVDEVQLTLDHEDGGREPVPAHPEEATASWLVGSDGASSTVRRQAGIGFGGEPFPEWFLVADVVVDGPVAEHGTAGTAGAHGEPGLGSGRANLFFSDAGATAVFPLPEPGLFRLATPLPVEYASDDAPVVDLAAIERLWATRIGRPARLSDPRWISPFQFHSRLASDYRRGRVFLAGDAAHVHSPVGGQGMNTGIQDAVNLAWKLAAVRRGAPESLLDTYGAERRPVAEQVLRETRRNAVLASSRSRAAGAGRAVGLRLVTGVPPLRRRFLGELTMLSTSYSRLALPGPPPEPSLSERLVTGAPTAGERAPDAPVVLGSDGEPGRLLDLLAPRSHVLLWFDAGRPGPGDWAVDLVGAGDPPEAGVSVVVVRRGTPDRAPTPPPTAAVEVHDPGGRAHRVYAARRPLAVLVRPDGVVAWAGALTRGSRPTLDAVLDATVPGRSPRTGGGLAAPGADRRGAA